MIEELRNVLSLAEATAATLSGAAGQVTNAVENANSAAAAAAAAGLSKTMEIVAEDALGTEGLDKTAIGKRKSQTLVVT